MDGAQPALPRTPSFNSSPLLRFLAGLQIADMAPTTQTFAERCSPWLDWTDAIALSAVLNGGPAARPASASASARSSAPASARTLIDDCRRVRSDLTQAITTEALFKPAAATAGAAAKPPVPAASSAAKRLADEPAFAPLRRQYLAHQRAMDARIAPLRARLRAALSAHSAALAQLAALDAVLDQALGERERHLLSTVPRWLEQHLDRRPPAEAPSSPGLLMQSALLAELDLRLQPVQAMIEALADQSPAA